MRIDERINSALFDLGDSVTKEEIQSGFKDYMTGRVYFDEEGAPRHGWFEVSGKKYYGGTNCILITGMHDLHSDWLTYEFDEDGALIGFHDVH